MCIRDRGKAVAHAGRGGDDIQIELAFQPLGDDLHVQQAKEAAAETEAQRRTRLQLNGCLLYTSHQSGLPVVAVYDIGGEIDVEQGL